MCLHRGWIIELDTNLGRTRLALSASRSTFIRNFPPFSTMKVLIYASALFIAIVAVSQQVIAEENANSAAPWFCHGKFPEMLILQILVHEIIRC